MRKNAEGKGKNSTSKIEGLQEIDEYIIMIINYKIHMIITRDNTGQNAAVQAVFCCTEC